MISSPCFTDWCFGTMEWIMTFQKQLGTIIPTDFHIFQRARWLNHQAVHHFHHVFIPWWEWRSPSADVSRRSSRTASRWTPGAWWSVARRGARNGYEVPTWPRTPKPLVVGADDRAEVGEMVRNHVGLWMAPDFYGISAGGLMDWSQMTSVFCSTGPPISMTACTPSSLAWTCLQAPFSGSHLDFSGCIRLA